MSSPSSPVMRVAVSHISKEAHADQIDGQTHSANYQDQHGVLYRLNQEKSLQ